MTAPDVNADVRARFEAWLASQGFTSKPEQRTSGKYVNGQIQGNWLAWQAARADPAGEVRELKLVIEGLSQYSHNAQEVRELVEALQKLAAYPLEEFALEEKPERKLFGANDWELHAKDVLDARAALAKFHPTHRETK